MRIAVFGAGGVGGYFGGRLAQAGEDVVFIARGDHLKAMLTHGLRVDSVKGDFVLKPVKATDDPAQAGIVDVILVGVKAWQVTNAAEAMRPMVGPETFVLPLQNGLEAPTQLAAVLGDQHVLGGLCGLSTFIVGPGHIRHAGAEPFVRFGELDNRPSDRRNPAGYPGSPVDEVPVYYCMEWSGSCNTYAARGMAQPARNAANDRKCASRDYNSGASPRHCLARKRYAHEMNMYDSFPPDITSSMQRDIAEGRPSELDAQIGAVVRFGKEADVATPLHRLIYNSLLPMELRARGQVQFPA